MTFDEWWEASGWPASERYAAEAGWDAATENAAKLAEAEAGEYEDAAVIDTLNAMAAKLRCKP